MTNPDPVIYLASDRRTHTGQKRKCEKIAKLDWQHSTAGGKESWQCGPFHITSNFGGPITTYNLHISGVYMQWFAQCSAAMRHAEGIARRCVEALG